jgi:hypothetical protein
MTTRALVGRGLMVALGIYFWLYVFRPKLPLVRSLSWWYRLAPGDPILRGWCGAVGTVLIVLAFVV